MNNLLIGLVLSSFLFSCANVLEGRTFISAMDRESDGLFVAGRDFMPVAGDTGVSYRTKEEIGNRTPYSEREGMDRYEYESLQHELVQKEMRLTETGKMQYQEAASILETTSEKIYFLNLSENERESYLNTRRVGGVRGNSRSIASIPSAAESSGRNLYLGMNKNDVVSKWGRPDRVDIAGNPSYENERWAFRAADGMHYVYFEKGTVQGWKTD